MGKSKVLIRDLTREMTKLSKIQKYEQAGQIKNKYKQIGIDLPDAILAATAQFLGIQVATLNAKHFPKGMVFRPY